MAKKVVETVMRTVTVQMKVDIEIDTRKNIWDQIKPHFEERLKDGNPRDYSIVS